MRTLYTLLCAFLFSTFFISCTKDDEIDPPPASVIVQLFENTAVMENSSTLEFKLNFDKPAAANGFIIVGVSSTREGTFQTLPETIEGEMEVPVQKGARFATIQFTPQDNGVLEENAIVTLTLLSKSEGINFGSKRSTTIEITDNEAPALASFFVPNITASEFFTPSVEVRIVFSSPSPGQGSIVVQLEGDDSSYYVDSYPEMDNQKKLVLPIEAGTVYTTFQLRPKNNSVLENHKTLKLKILEVDGVLAKGEITEMNILLLDDEIQGKKKSVETVSNGKRTKRTWEYATDGKINKVLWEDQATQLITGTLSYYYNPEGTIRNITSFTGDGETYIWDNNGRIVTVEKISNFFKVGYSSFEYGANGKIHKKTDYTIRAGGDFAPKTQYVYDYFADGNLQKQSTYIQGNNSNWVLNASLAFSQYSGSINPAPIEVIPSISTQQHLPSIFHVTGDGINNSNYYTYTFNAEGMVTKRITVGETTTYIYY